MTDTDPTRRPFTITCVRRDPEHGFWRARVTSSTGATLDVDRRYGSWQGDRRVRAGARTFTRCDVLADVAAALQARVRRAERQELRAPRDTGVVHGPQVPGLWDAGVPDGYRGPLVQADGESYAWLTHA